MTSEQHKCPVEGCRHTDVDQDRVMCWKHWGMVPKDLQNQVYRWAAMSKKRGRIQSEHLQAIRQAIEAVNDKCRRVRLLDQGVRAMEFPDWFSGDTRGIR